MNFTSHVTGVGDFIEKKRNAKDLGSPHFSEVSVFR